MDGGMKMSNDRGRMVREERLRMRIMGMRKQVDCSRKGLMKFRREAEKYIVINER